MPSIAKLFGAIALLALWAVSPGCQTHPMVDTDGDQFENGTLVAIEDKQLNEVYAALKQAQFELNLEEMNQRKDGLNATVVMSSARNRTIFMELESVAADRTMVNIRYGFLGDQQRSKRLLTEIRRRYEDPATRRSSVEGFQY